MLKITKYFLFLIILCCSSCSDSKYTVSEHSVQVSEHSNELLVRETPQAITLSPGDSLTISVWRESELEQDVVVDINGDIYFSFIGKVHAAGLTIEELSKVLADELSVYFLNPKVTVSPQEFSGLRFFVLGEVEEPGKFTMSDRISLMEAVAGAGGPNIDAKEMMILLRKEEEKLFVHSIPYSYQKVTSDHVLPVSMQIVAGDIIYIPPKSIANVERFMQRLENILAPILSLERGIILWPALVDALNASSSEVLVR